MNGIRISGNSRLAATILPIGLGSIVSLDIPGEREPIQLLRRLKVGDYRVGAHATLKGFEAIAQDPATVAEWNGTHVRIDFDSTRSSYKGPYRFRVQSDFSIAMTQIGVSRTITYDDGSAPLTIDLAEVAVLPRCLQGEDDKELLVSFRSSGYDPEYDSGAVSGAEIAFDELREIPSDFATRYHSADAATAAKIAWRGSDVHGTISLIPHTDYIALESHALGGIPVVTLGMLSENFPKAELLPGETVTFYWAFATFRGPR